MSMHEMSLKCRVELAGWIYQMAWSSLVLELIPNSSQGLMMTMESTPAAGVTYMHVNCVAGEGQQGIGQNCMRQILAEKVCNFACSKPTRFETSKDRGKALQVSFSQASSSHEVRDSILKVAIHKCWFLLDRPI